MVGAHGLIVDQDGLARRAGGQLGPGEHAGCHAPIRVGHNGARADRAGASVNGVAHEVERAPVRETLVRGQPDLHGQRGLAAGARSGPRAAHDVEVRGFVDVEVHVQRVDGHDRGQQRGRAGDTAADQVALGHEHAVNAPGDGRRDAGVGQIQPRRSDGGLGRLHLGLARTARGDGIVVGLARDSAGRHQALGAVEVGLGLTGQHLGLLQLRRSRVERDLERSGVDLEQQLSLAHQAALGDAHSIDGAADPRAQLDGLGRGQEAGVLGRWRDRAGDDLGHGHLRRHRRARRGRRGLALVLGVAGGNRYAPDGCDDACHHNDSDFFTHGSAPFLDAGLRPFRSALQKFVWRLGVTTKARSSPLGCPSGQAAWTRWWENPASSLWPLRHPAHECRCAVEPVGLVGDCERGRLRRPSCRRPLLCLRGIPAPRQGPRFRVLRPGRIEDVLEANRRRGYRRLATCHSPGCLGLVSRRLCPRKCGPPCPAAPG